MVLPSAASFFPIGIVVMDVDYDKFLGAALGGYTSIEPATKAAIHHVFRVKTEQGDYYLKHRSTVYAKTPSHAADPFDMAYEAAALQIMHEVAPNNCPALIAYDRDSGLLLMTDIMSPGDNLEDRLYDGSASKSQGQILGTTLAALHRALSVYGNDKRLIRDTDIYETNLFYKFDSLNYPHVSETAMRLRREPRQLIHGDLSPKNIGIDDSIASFCDFDNSHYGNFIYDAGFILGHLILHTACDAGQSIAGAFMEAYTADEQYFRDVQRRDLLARTALGACIYRLDNKWVKYEIKGLTENGKSLLLQQVTAKLAEESIALEDICSLKI